MNRQGNSKQTKPQLRGAVASENNTYEYLGTELEHFQKNAETQFTHFMGVFYFWTAVVTAPVTAGLVKSEEIQPRTLGMLLLLIAILGLFLAAKMFDIRASQLNYIILMNRIRWIFYQDVKENLPEAYSHPYEPTEDLRARALSFRDFGLLMAITMGFLNAFIFAFAWPMIQILPGSSRSLASVSPNIPAFFTFWIISIGIYRIFIVKKVLKTVESNGSDS